MFLRLTFFCLPLLFSGSSTLSLCQKMKSNECLWAGNINSLRDFKLSTLVCVCVCEWVRGRWVLCAWRPTVKTQSEGPKNCEAHSTLLCFYLFTSGVFSFICTWCIYFCKRWLLRVQWGCTGMWVLDENKGVIDVSVLVMWLSSAYPNTSFPHICDAVHYIYIYTCTCVMSCIFCVKS